MRIVIYLVGLLVTFSCLAQSDAQQTVISADDVGWYNASGFHIPTASNYIVGRTETQGVTEDFHNFAVFDVSQVSGTIVSAKVMLFNVGPPDYGGNGFSSPDATENYRLYDVTTELTDLLDGTAGLSAFDDLGSGVSFGEVIVSDADNNSFITVELNAAGLAALNASNGFFAVGGAITTLRDVGTNAEQLFARSQENSVIRLEVTTATIAEYVPDTFQTFRGLLVAGTLADVQESDDLDLQFNPGFVLNSSEFPVWISFPATLGSGSPSDLSVSVEASVNTPGIKQTIQVYNFSTSQFDNVDMRDASFNSDSVAVVDLTSAVADYVDPNGGVEIRPGWKVSGFTILYPWQVDVDRVLWTTVK